MAFVGRRPELDRLEARLAALRAGQTVGAGHFAMVEVPEQVIGMIEAFLVSPRLAAVGIS